MGYTQDPYAGLGPMQTKMLIVGFTNFQGKHPRNMSEAECTVAFEWLSKNAGISYIWY